MIIQNSYGQSQAAMPEARAAGDPAPKTIPAKATVSTAQALAAASEPTAAKLRQAVDGINQAMRSMNANLNFSIDPDTHHVVVRVVDAETGELIRQLPPKVALGIAAQIDQVLQEKKGLLLTQSA